MVNVVPAAIALLGVDGAGEELVGLDVPPHPTNAKQVSPKPNRALFIKLPPLLVEAHSVYAPIRKMSTPVSEVWIKSIAMANQARKSLVARESF
jgi:hypothetical protein